MHAIIIKYCPRIILFLLYVATRKLSPSHVTKKTPPRPVIYTLQPASPTL